MRPICPIDFKHFASLITEETTGHQSLQCTTLNGKLLKLKRLFKLICFQNSVITIFK